jgi:HK97 family phage major capsid protein
MNTQTRPAMDGRPHPSRPSAPITVESNPAVVDVQARLDQARSTLRQYETIARSRVLTPDEESAYKVARRNLDDALAASADLVAEEAKGDHDALTLAIRSVGSLDPGEVLEVSLRDYASKYLPDGTVEVRGTNALSGGTAGLGGNTIPAAAQAPLFVAYRDPIGLVDRVEEVLVTTRSGTLTTPNLTVGAVMADATEADPQTISDVTFTRGSTAFTKWTARTQWSAELEADCPDDLPVFMSQEHGRAARRRAETALVAAVTAAAGNTHNAAPSNLAAILAGRTTVEADGFTPSVLVIHPTSWATLASADAARMPSGQLVKEVTGLDLVVSTAAPVGTALIGDPGTVRLYRRDLVPTRLVNAPWERDSRTMLTSWRVAVVVHAVDGWAKVATT